MDSDLQHDVSHALCDRAVLIGSCVTGTYHMGAEFAKMAALFSHVSKKAKSSLNARQKLHSV